MPHRVSSQTERPIRVLISALEVEGMLGVEIRQCQNIEFDLLKSDTAIAPVRLHLSKLFDMP